MPISSPILASVERPDEDGDEEGAGDVVEGDALPELDEAATVLFAVESVVLAK